MDPGAGGGFSERLASFSPHRLTVWSTLLNQLPRAPAGAWMTPVQLAAVLLQAGMEEKVSVFAVECSHLLGGSLLCSSAIR
jgi:hypothetical protein